MAKIASCKLFCICIAACQAASTTWHNQACQVDDSAAEKRNKIKSYGIKFPESGRFLGMPKRRNWILYAQQLDPFGVKNWLGFNLSRGTGEYASSTQFAEVKTWFLWRHIAKS